MYQINQFIMFAPSFPINLLLHKIQNKLTYKERRLADQLIFISSNKKIEEVLNWKPKIQLNDGLNKYLDWLVKI